MKGLTAKSRIAIGQVGLLTSLVLIAILLGLVPDRTSAVLQGRAVLAEALAANSSVFVTQADIRRLAADLRLVVDRNPDIFSAAVRRSEGQVVAAVGEHQQSWIEMIGEYSTDTQVQVLIWAGNKKWGQIELRFRPLVFSGWRGVVANPWLQLIVFLGASAFIVFSIYLSGQDAEAPGPFPGHPRPRPRGARHNGRGPAHRRCEGAYRARE
jgi:hypothetical protein